MEQMKWELKSSCLLFTPSILINLRDMELANISK